MDIKYKYAAVVLIIAGAIILGACADWWAFNQKFPHASFWAWVISPR